VSGSVARRSLFIPDRVPVVSLQIDVLQVDQSQDCRYLCREGRKVTLWITPNELVRRGATTFPVRSEELRAIVLGSQ
jgi:hypothetical protein